MREKYIQLVLVLLAITTPIFGYEPTDNDSIYNFGVSLGVASGCTIGVGKIQDFEKKSKGITYNFHYLQNSDYFVTGFYYQINSYRHNQRKGFFTVIIAGVDYIKGEEEPLIVFNPGGPNQSDYDKRKIDGLFPNLTFGLGYSIPISQKNRFLIFLDLGFKKTITNLNFSVNI